MDKWALSHSWGILTEVLRVKCRWNISPRKVQGLELGKANMWGWGWNWRIWLIICISRICLNLFVCQSHIWVSVFFHFCKRRDFILFYRLQTSSYLQSYLCLKVCFYDNLRYQHFTLRRKIFLPLLISNLHLIVTLVHSNFMSEFSEMNKLDRRRECLHLCKSIRRCK